MNTKERAPKGGKTVAGVFYKGGQFLPSNNEPKRGAFNGIQSIAKMSSHKVQVGHREYAFIPEGTRSIYTWIAGYVATLRFDKLVYMGNEQRLAYVGLTESQAKDLIARWNNGERYVMGQ